MPLGTLPAILPVLKETTGLGAGGTLSLSALLAKGMTDGGTAPVKEDHKVGTTTLLAEGIPPTSTKLVERIRLWQFVDLAELLTDATANPLDTLAPSMEGQILLVQSMEQVRRRRKQISDVASWTQAFSIFVATLASAESTKKEELAGLLAHQYVILQIQKDLGGMKWYHYDKQFREWAAAANCRVWGPLNLSIYGRCLSAPVGAPISTENHRMPPTTGKREAKRAKGRNKACFKYNFEVSCGRAESDCYYDHVCWHCGSAEHIAEGCPRGPKRPNKENRGRTN